MITVVLGGQYGSEGKGSVVSWLARNTKFDLVIRTGSPNAGHTFKDCAGTIFKMRQLPCTWAFQHTDVYVPAGAVVNLAVLESETKMMREDGWEGQVHVSPQASVISYEAMEQEKVISTGTTGEGVGATRAMKCLRQAKLVRDFYNEGNLRESQRVVHHLLSNPDKHILIEASQGYGLSMDRKEYPFCTSTNLDTYRVLSDAEVPAGVHHQTGVVLVLRTFPIRIAGNSGHLFNETSWEKLRLQYGNHIPDEQTTVTKKTRRVGEFDPELAQEAYHRCGANNVVLTFVDYVFPNIAETGVTKEVDHWVSHLEGLAGLNVNWLGIGIGEVIPRFYIHPDDAKRLKRLTEKPEVHDPR